MHPLNSNTASPVAQNNQGRAQSLGRGLCSLSVLQSPEKRKTLRILQCNINGLSTKATRTKLDQLLNLAETHGAQIIAIQETKLREHATLRIRGFHIFRTDRQCHGGGGLAFLIRDLKYQEIRIQPFTDSDLEIQGITVNWKGRPVNIFNVYHPPNHKSLPEDLLNIPDHDTFLIGDLNAKHPSWGCSVDNHRGNELLNLLDDKAFMLLNDGTATHTSYSYNTSEALDVSMVSPDIYTCCKWQVLHSVGSDHFPVLIELMGRQKTHKRPENYWNFKKANWAAFEELVENTFSSDCCFDSVDEHWSFFRKAVLKAAGQTIPRGYIKKATPFFGPQSSDLESLITKRNLLHEELRTTHNSSIRTDLNKINAEIKRRYIINKREKWMEFCKKLDVRTSTTRLWKLAKSIDKIQPQKEHSNALIDSTISIPLEDKVAANLLGGHYQKSSRLPFDENDKTIEKRSRNITHGCRSSSGGIPLFSNCFSLQELELAMKDLDLSKSPGPDGIHGLMIDHLGLRGRQCLLDIFNHSWRCGRLPRDWKRALIIPIQKIGKSANSPENYRPIALTSVSCKLMEKMILYRLTFYLDSNDLLPRAQYGFRKGHSTTDQVLYFGQCIRDAQNLKPTNHTAAAFLDLSKAFDRVWRNKLIVKLYESFNIRGSALAWISDFMQNRLIKVKYGSAFSDNFRLFQGVPQGSVLSPTLFSLFLEGLEEVLNGICKIGIFADDIVLWDSNSDIKLLESNLNLALSRVQNFAAEHKLTFNVSKSVTSFFTTNKHLYNYHPQLFLRGVPLSYEKHPRYLGFVLDPEFTCNKHIEALVAKSRKRLNILKYISGRDWGADATTLRTTYISLVRPVLEYGLQIYSSASTSNLQKLDRVQQCAGRIITGLRHSCPSEIVLFEADLLPLNMRRELSLVKYFSKLLSYGAQHRTANYLLHWSNNQRLKRDSPFSRTISLKAVYHDVEPHFLKPCVDPLRGMPRVYFQPDLLSSTNKSSDTPELLNQLALEIINTIPEDSLQVYTDGSRDDQDSAGSGVFIKGPDKFINIKLRNPDSCSVFRSELLAIEAGLNAIEADSGFSRLSPIWILTDSRSSIQYLSAWHRVGDRTGTAILQHLCRLSVNRDIYLQWIPSHVGIYGNEIADSLAKLGTTAPLPENLALTFSEIHSIRKRSVQHVWKTPPAHIWYSGDEPGRALTFRGVRSEQTAFTRFISGHLKCMKYEQHQKVFPICNKCSSSAASPDHLLSCVDFSKEDFLRDPVFFFDFLRVNGLMDLV